MNAKQHDLYVPYLRVSTSRQGASGLGLDGQRASINTFLNGGTWRLSDEFIEIETGTRKRKRPVLNDAIAFCQKTGGTLLVAKGDRLSRDVAAGAALLSSGVPIVAVDMPHAGRFEWHIRLAIAEEEVRMISERTRSALKAAKARGTILGNPRLHEARKVAQDNAGARAETLRDTFIEMKAKGFSQHRMVAHLNTLKVKTPSGKDGATWSRTQVQRTLKRLEF